MIIAVIITVLFMNGSRLGIETISDEDAETYEGTEYFTVNDQNGNWQCATTVDITLNGESVSINGSGAYFSSGSLVIAQSGYYEIEGSLTNGSIIVDANDNSKVFIRLKGVDVYCEDDAAFRVNEADKVFLTLAKDSENVFTSGKEYSAEALADGAGGVIYAHDDLTINGSGSLTVNAAYKHGIEANDDLVITGGSISITAPKDAITVNGTFAFKGASLDITAADDAIHSDDEIYIESGRINIATCYEGLEAMHITIAGGDVTIYPSDDGLNATDPDSTGGGFGMMAGFGGSSEGDEETNIEDLLDDDLPYVYITGGRLTIINEDASDADGIDSNGSIIISGGEISVNLKGSGTNCALDYGSESGGKLVINGGTLYALGASQMVEEVDSSSGQISILYNMSKGVAAGDTITIKDSEGNVIIEVETMCTTSSAIISSPRLKMGETYEIIAGENDETITIDEINASNSEDGGGMGGMFSFGAGHGGGGHGGGGRGGDANDEDSNDSGKVDSMNDHVNVRIDRDADASGEDPDEKSDGKPGDSNIPDGGQMMDEGQPGGGDMPDMGNMEEMPEPENMEGMPGDGEMPEMGDMPDGGDMPDMGQMGPGMEGQADAEEAEAVHTISDYSLSDWLILAGCLVLIAGGIGFAVSYRRRR